AGAPAPDGITGPDGPECASALLGRTLAAGDPAGGPTGRCPADTLTPDDADALRDTVNFLAVLGNRNLTLVADGTPRSAAAARSVRSAAAAAGIGVATPDRPSGPLLIVSGWSTADSALRRATAGGRIPPGGTYLAPWLATAPLLEIRAGAHIPLRSGLDGELPGRYRDALRAGYPGQTPSAAGYRAWLAEQRIAETDPVRIYQVVNGATIPMSGPLDTP
ncbi:MAG TPA: hypothetical protein VGX25_29415, partial [Actinophytocola sp.]|nr:hypothetical protein [Actinophytocola sp.]